MCGQRRNLQRTDPGGATVEAIRCVRDLGALGVPKADAVGAPLDEEIEMMPEEDC